MWRLRISGRNNTRILFKPGTMGAGDNGGMFLHTPTLLVTNIAVTATLGISLGAVASRSRPDGMQFWAWALAMHTTAFILFSLRGQISDVLSIVVANGFLAATAALFAEGLYQFQQRKVRRWLIWCPVVLIIANFSLLLQHATARIGLGVAILIAQCVLFLGQVLQRRRDTPGHGQYFVATGLVFAIVGLMVRAADALSGGVEATSITSSRPIQAGTFLFATIIIMFISLGLVMMTKERADERNRALALQDELTGLSNRRDITAALAQQVAVAHRSGRSLALLILDLDHFKRINDTFGHLSGDKTLRQLADCIRSRLRTQDVAGRWGGEEFIIILPGTDAQGARALAEDLRVSVEQTRFESTDGRPMPVTISIGLHAPDATAGESGDDLIDAADQALYMAKLNGRNRVEQR